MRCNRISPFFVAVCALTAVIVPQTVNAAEWSMQPTVRFVRGYDDNIRLTLLPHNSVTNWLFAPKVDWGVSSDIWQATVGAEAVQNRFSGDSSLNTDDRIYNFSASYKTERSIWQVTGSQSQNSILAGQLASNESAVVQTQQIYDARSISPSWTWLMTERTQLQLAYSFAGVSYVNGVSARLYDYSTRSVSTTLTNALSQKEQVFFSAGYSVYNVPATALSGVENSTFVNTLKSKGATYQAGITRTFSETTRGTLSAGLRKSSSEQDGYQVFLAPCPPPFGFFDCPASRAATIFSKNSGTVFKGSFEKQLENNHFNITVSRTLDASGTSSQVQTDLLNVVFDHSFTPRLTGSLTYSNYAHATQTSTVSGTDNRFYYVVPALTWQLAQEWTFDANYRYTHLRRVSEDKPVTSNAVYLTLAYQWPKMAISR